MTPYEERRLQEQSYIPIPRKLDGSGLAWIYCKTATAEHFGLHKLDKPDDYGTLLPNGKRVRHMYFGKTSGANSLNLRIAYDWTPGRTKPDMVRFRVGGNPINETLQVFTNILNESGKDWLYLCNNHGNKLAGGFFKSSKP